MLRTDSNSELSFTQLLSTFKSSLKLTLRIPCYFVIFYNTIWRKIKRIFIRIGSILKRQAKRSIDDTNFSLTHFFTTDVLFNMQIFIENLFLSVSLSVYFIGWNVSCFYPKVILQVNHSISFSNNIYFIIFIYLI